MLEDIQEGSEPSVPEGCQHLYYLLSMPFPVQTADYTAFSVGVKAASALDLTTGALCRDHAIGPEPVDYAACQDLAETARNVGTEIIRFQSARDPSCAANLADLTYGAIRDSAPISTQSGRIRVSSTGAQAIRDYPRLGVEFGRDIFDHDPRIKGMDWEQ